MTTFEYNTVKVSPIPENSKGFKLEFPGGQTGETPSSFKDVLDSIPNIMQEQGWETYSVLNLGDSVVFFIRKAAVALMVPPGVRF